VLASISDGMRTSLARISDEDMARRAEEFVLRRIEADDLGLPTVPLVTTRCLEILSHAEFSVNEVSRLIETDPLCAAGVVRLANSAARATLEPSRSVLQSVMRLGGDELRSFMFEMSARPVFESHDATISNLGKALWMHSVAVALLARAVVRRNNGKQPEAAYLAGLLHDIGKPLMAAMLLDAERRLFNVRTRTWLFPATWIRLIATSHRRVGIALAEAWRLPDSVQRSVREANNYDTNDPSNPANAVRFANALAKHAGLYVGEVDSADLDSLLFVGRKLFSFSDSDIDALTDGLRERVTERLS
jgi:putative nucleotidyltransferase with HDIG domain